MAGKDIPLGLWIKAAVGCFKALWGYQYTAKKSQRKDMHPFIYFL